MGAPSLSLSHLQTTRTSLLRQRSNSLRPQMSLLPTAMSRRRRRYRQPTPLLPRPPCLLRFWPVWVGSGERTRVLVARLAPRPLPPHMPQPTMAAPSLMVLALELLSLPLRWRSLLLPSSIRRLLSPSIRASLAFLSRSQDSTRSGRVRRLHRSLTPTLLPRAAPVGIVSPAVFVLGFLAGGRSSCSL